MSRTEGFPLASLVLKGGYGSRSPTACLSSKEQRGRCTPDISGGEIRPLTETVQNRCKNTSEELWRFSLEPCHPVYYNPLRWWKWRL